MGSGASFDMGLNLEAADSERFFCHACHRIFPLGGVRSPQDYYCPHCQSTFLEELNEVSRHNDILSLGGGSAHSHLSSEQNLRISNATAMLRLLETQLREELEQLQVAFEAANVHMTNGSISKAKMTKLMLGKLRKTPLSLDTVCSQPSCPICSEDFALGSEAVKLPCGHLFHRVCVLHWLDMKQNCPICRTSISNDMPTRQELAELSVGELWDWLRELDVEITGTQQQMTDKRECIEQLLHSSLLEYQRMQEEQHPDQQQYALSANPFIRYRLAAAAPPSISTQHALGADRVAISPHSLAAAAAASGRTGNIVADPGQAAAQQGSRTLGRNLEEEGEEAGVVGYGEGEGGIVVEDSTTGSSSVSLALRAPGALNAARQIDGDPGILLASRRYNSSEGILHEFHRVLHQQNNMNSYFGRGGGGVSNSTERPDTTDSAPSSPPPLQNEGGGAAGNGN
jgi:hypothetical protein